MHKVASLILFYFFVLLLGCSVVNVNLDYILHNMILLWIIAGLYVYLT